MISPALPNPFGYYLFYIYFVVVIEISDSDSSDACTDGNAGSKKSKSKTKKLKKEDLGKGTLIVHLPIIFLERYSRLAEGTDPSAQLARKYTPRAEAEWIETELLNLDKDIYEFVRMLQLLHYFLYLLLICCSN